MPTRSDAGGWHQPVMVEEVLSWLAPRPGAAIVDGTAGTGGHTIAIAPRLLPEGRLIAIDRDHTALQRAAARLADFGSMVSMLHGNYRELPQLLQQLGLEAVDGVLLDLGMSSLQVDDPGRGFSFLSDGPLDMRMDQSETASAETLVNTLSVDELEELIRSLGEERFARRIAQRIGRERIAAPITTTRQLAALIASSVPPAARYGRLHPATRTFQALRMAVNDELGALEALLACLADLLKPGGRAVIITFHSLEDRLVKRAFLQGQRNGAWRVLTKKPVRPSEAERERNPRARSAKLRVIERCPAT
ncbi:MAG: 16S rRNA (cytosine(1402)-N(4))-methyltransferase RsmH [Candidatus Omnitrophica bacterium]|nr:16S rRNA (cytosine(1402)-N(4))-methyltransferase RsmH [Candidatus Omnitrophota bacterium]